MKVFQKLVLVAFILLSGIYIKGKEVEESEVSCVEFPQTVTYKIVNDFLNTECIENKKVLIIGYDGFRRDGLENLQEDGAVSKLLETGEQYLTYAGGDVGQQDTSTAPGWTSILTGGWSEYTKISTNGDTKPLEAKTMLQEAEEMGYQASFTSSWSTHFDASYINDINSVQNGVEFTYTANDEETIATVSKQIEDGTSDVIFLILEAADHAGHTTGYGNDNPIYQDACVEADQYAKRLLDVISQTSNSEEEWLILITTDHGGVEFNHGNQSEVERNTWLVSNRKNLLTMNDTNYKK